MSSDTPPDNQLIIYETEDGRTRVQCLFDDETLWLTQAQMADLYQKDVRTINEHLGNIMDEGEFTPSANYPEFPDSSSA